MYRQIATAAAIAYGSLFLSGCARNLPLEDIFRVPGTHYVTINIMQMKNPPEERLKEPVDSTLYRDLVQNALEEIHHQRWRNSWNHHGFGIYTLRFLEENPEGEDLHDIVDIVYREHPRGIYVARSTLHSKGLESCDPDSFSDYLVGYLGLPQNNGNIMIRKPDYVGKVKAHHWLQFFDDPVYSPLFGIRNDKLIDDGEWIEPDNDATIRLLKEEKLDTILRVVLSQVYTLPWMMQDPEARAHGC